MFKFVYITCLLIHFLQYNLYTAISWILCNKRQSQRCTIVSCHFGRYRILPPQSAFDCEPKTVQIFIPGPTWHDTMVFAESIFLILGWHTKNEGVKFKCKSFLMKPLKTFAGLNEGLKSLVEQNWRNFFLQVISMISMMISHACYCAKLKFKIYAFITKLINALFFNIFSIDH